MSEKPLTIFMLLKTMPDWLKLSRQDRAVIADKAFADAFATANVNYRHFDAEAFSGRCTDIGVFEARDLQSYYFAIERLRDTPIFSHPYFEVVDIIPALENGFVDFEAAETAGLNPQEAIHAL